MTVIVPDATLFFIVVPYKVEHLIIIGMYLFKDKGVDVLIIIYNNIIPKMVPIHVEDEGFGLFSYV